MKTFNKVYIIGTIISIIMGASGAFAYFTHSTPNSVSINSSSELSPTNEANVTMQTFSTSDEHISNNYDTFTHYNDFNETKKEVTVNPDPFNQALTPSAQSEELPEYYNVLSTTENSLNYTACNQTMEDVNKLAAYVNTTLEKLKNDTSKNITNALIESVGVFLDNYSTKLPNLSANLRHCEGDIHNYPQVCHNLKNLDLTNTNFNNTIQRVLVFNGVNENIDENIKIYIQELYQNLPNTSNQKCPQLTKKSPELSTNNGGISMSKNLIDRRLNMREIEKILFMICILKLHF